MFIKIILFKLEDLKTLLMKWDKDIIKTASLPTVCMYQGHWKDTKHAKQLNQTETISPGGQKHSKVFLLLGEGD